MTAFFVISGVLFVLGVLLTLIYLKNWRRRARIIATPTSPIAEAPGNANVEVKGRIVPSEEGVVQTPFSGRDAVWTRVTVQERRSSSKRTYWHTLLTEVDGCSFMIDDGSGQLARVLPNRATVVLDKQNVASSGTFHDASPRLEQFLAAHGLKSTSLFGFNKTMRYEEELLEPGDPVYALGPSRREAGPPVNDGYRMSPSSELVMFVGDGAEDELILTNKTEEQLTSRLLTGFVVGLVMTAVGLVGAVGGAVASLLGLLG